MQFGDDVVVDVVPVCCSVYIDPVAPVAPVFPGLPDAPAIDRTVKHGDGDSDQSISINQLMMERGLRWLVHSRV